MSIYPVDRTAVFDDLRRLVPTDKIEQSIEEWAQVYQTNSPFPHIGIDDFFHPLVINDLITEFPGEFDASWMRGSLDEGQYVEQKLALPRIEDIPPRIRCFIDALNSRPFIEFLERLTGINGLIPDPHLSGGGLHMIPRGGRLGIHADFNIHQKLRLDRRLNILVYLNKDWPTEWGGELELWDRDMKAKVKSFAPIANRVIVFSTTDTSFHGHPDPLTCPRGTYRRSIALYYYTHGRPEEERSESHSTLFKLRPGEIPRKSALDRIKPFVPPIVWQVRRLLKR